jgi:3-oxosteroid 1-dehydrogenase
MDVGWGPAWMLAAEVGAQIVSEPFILKMIAIHVPGETFPNGRPVGRTNYERFMQHSILVNRYGERFDDEAFYSGGGRVANHFDDWQGHRFRNFPNYFVFDRNLLEKYSFAGMPPGNLQGLDWVAQAATIPELARKLDISSRGLEDTVRRFNNFVRRGNDSDFNRSARTLGAIERPPFYGVQTATPDPFSTLTTVATNPNSQVVNYKTEQPISGLYCCGALSTTSRIWGIGYQGGFQFSGGAIFGFLAAEHAAKVPT